jgi:hypothetical protein
LAAPTPRDAGGMRFCCIVGFMAEVFEAGSAGVVLGGTTVVLGGTTVVFGGTTVVFGGTTVVFAGTTVVFGGTTVVFAGGTACCALGVGIRDRAGVGCDGVRDVCVP